MSRPNQLLHGSEKAIEAGTSMRGGAQAYIDKWGDRGFYKALEHHRPKGCIAHHDAVFLGYSMEDVDLGGGLLDFILVVQPVGPVYRHDLNWSTEISGLVDDGFAMDSPEVKKAAYAYWMGIPSRSGPVWEYTCKEVRVIGCFSDEQLERGEADPDTMVFFPAHEPESPQSGPPI